MEKAKIAIKNKYDKFKNDLGTATGNIEQLSDGWFKQKYTKGAIYYKDGVGTYAVFGAIYSKYVEFKAEKGQLGFPKTDETATPDRVGRYNHFQYGSIYWTPTTGAHEIHGSIRDKWAALSWERGFLGYPLTDECTTPDRIGRYTHFQGGSIYWTPSTGAHEVHGAIRDKWAALSWENGHLGYPLTDECTTPDTIGRFNHFQGGSIYWSPSTGAHEVHGAIRTKWESLGWERGYLGYPLTDECTTPDTIGRYTHFQGGSIYWTPSTGAQSVRMQIRNKWESLGWENGYLGYPLNDTQGSPTSSLSNKFQGGIINWTPSSGARVSTPYTKVKFILDEIYCRDETSELSGSDEIFITGTALDNNWKEYRLPAINLGSFDGGKRKYPNRTLVELPINDTGWPKGLVVTVLLVEDDGKTGVGGLSGIQTKILAKVKEEAKKAIAGLKVAASVVAGPVGTVIGYIGGHLAGGMIDAAIKAIISSGEDDYFPPFSCYISIPSVYSLTEAAGATSTPKQHYRVTAHGGSYDLYYHWQLA